MTPERRRRARRSEQRKCSSCATAITNKSRTGLCHACWMQWHNARPETHQKIALGLKRKWESDPDFAASQTRKFRRAKQKAAADPAIRAQLSELGKRNYHHLTRPEVIAKKEAAVKANGWKIREFKLGWCPEEYREEYRRLQVGRKHNAAQAREIIERKIAENKASKHVFDALEYLRRFAPVGIVENGYRYGNAILTAAEVVDRAKLRGWQPDRWAA